MDFKQLIDQYSGLILVGLAGYLGANLKNISSTIQSILVKYIGHRIHVDTNSAGLLYDFVVEYVISMKPDLFDRNIRLTYDNLKESLGESPNVYRGDKPDIKDGSYSFIYKMHLIQVLKTHIDLTHKDIGSDTIFILDITIIGLNSKAIQQELFRNVADGLKEHDNRYKDKDHVIMIAPHPVSDKRINRKSYETIISKERDMYFNIITRFLNSKDYYNRIGRLFKLGIILYGPPGTGKTSLINTTMDYLYRNSETPISIEYKNITYSTLKMLGDGTSNNSYVDTYSVYSGMLEKSELSIYVIEEIDRYVEDEVLLNVLMQFLDGLSSPDNAIIIATTNNLDVIPDVLKRPGRFDYFIHMDNFNEEEAKELCNLMQVDYTKIKDRIEYPVNPAWLQTELISIKQEELFK